MLPLSSSVRLLIHPPAANSKDSIPMELIRRVKPLHLVTSACCLCVVAGTQGTEGGYVTYASLALAAAFGIAAFLKSRDR